jgi:hypothetical protein
MVHNIPLLSLGKKRIWKTFSYRNTSSTFHDQIFKSFNRFPFLLKQVCPAVDSSDLVTIFFYGVGLIAPLPTANLEH